ncbi:unnamed protein product [Urochloa decumbens]|uniref:CRIB domain-containing protein n=1 Tax=Urochloa decumbens TaxID=240449 RepID=A0ABC8ZUC0_9POAL
MAISIKGIFRGLKIIAQIFTVQREHEIEIGYPTNVRHVSHIGFDASGSCPSWMSEFRGVEEVPAAGEGAASISSAAAQSSQTSWASLGANRWSSFSSQPGQVTNNFAHTVGRSQLANATFAAVL